MVDDVIVLAYLYRYSRVEQTDSISDVAQMLNRISYEFLKKTAIYGAVLSVSGCSVLYYLIQRKG